MKRLDRWFLRVLAMLSLLLCLVTAGIWASSYDKGYSIALSANAFDFALRTDPGTFTAIYQPAEVSWDSMRPAANEFRVMTQKWTYDTSPPIYDRPIIREGGPVLGFSWRWLDDATFVLPRPANVLSNTLHGFVWERGPVIYIGQLWPTAYRFTLPYWPLVCLFGVWPVALLRRMIGQRRAAKGGRCEQCGCDMRMTPERCPNCGAVPENRSVVQRLA